MNSRMFKFFHGHVITNGNVFVSDCLIELLQSQIFIFKKSHGGSAGSLDALTPRRVGEVSVLDLVVGAGWSRTTTGVDFVEGSTFCFLLP